MIKNRNKEKAYNAITYFTQHTNSCYKKKLYKLLFLLDFEHFQQTGRSVTGYNYFAWKMGPVPTELHEQIDAHEGEFAENFDIKKEILGIDKSGQEVEATSLISKNEFEPRFFSDRQLEILQSLCERFDISTGNEMEQFTHREGMPWDKVWKGGEGKQKEIPYEYSLDYSDTQLKTAILEVAEERKAFIEAFK